MPGRGIRSAAIALLLVAGLAAGCGAGPVTRVEIRIHYSTFEPETVTVARGVPITFVLINEDPIDHEWLIGDATFHERHRDGTEPQHGQRPNEISLPALTTIQTTLTFSEPGEILYICHFPSHESFGMVGTLTVL
ncbi:MAG: plastocyanin/azurin family copper-binding protein [Chloroflexota bacterium]